MLRLQCQVCDERIVGWDAVEGHVAGHLLVGDRVRVIWASTNGLVLHVAASNT